MSESWGYALYGLFLAIVFIQMHKTIEHTQRASILQLYKSICMNVQNKSISTLWLSIWT